MPATASRRTSALLAAATASGLRSLSGSLFALSKDAFARLNINVLSELCNITQ